VKLELQLVILPLLHQIKSILNVKITQCWVAVDNVV